MTDLSALLRDLRALHKATDANEWLVDGGQVYVDTRYQVCCGRGTYECCGQPDVAGEYHPISDGSPETAAFTAAVHNAFPAIAERIEELEGLLRRALPSVEADAQMMGAMDRHAPLPAADMPSVTTEANRLDTLAAEIRAALPQHKEPLT